MDITLIDGFPGVAPPELRALIQGLKTKDHDLKVFHLSQMDIKSCTGCWGCWVKKPGSCVIPDDTIDIRDAAIHSDLLLFVSPIIMGYTSAVLKKVQDKLIPLLLPYIELVDSESHHQARYDSYPVLGLLYQPEAETDDQDLQMIRDMYSRMALNFKSEFVLQEELKTFVEQRSYETIDYQRIAQG